MAEYVSDMQMPLINGYKEKDSSKQPEEWPSGKRLACTKITCGLILTAVIAAVYFYLSGTGHLSIIMDVDAFKEHIAGLGMLGPLSVIFFMTAAIVFSPIPSAPIALAAGALYGHTWGTLYIVIGAEAGAMLAFTTARLLGHDVIHRWFGKRLSLNPLGGQNTLMALVFVSRLVPFISFDIVSYAAGLSSLKFWRFALATFGGILPASFLLAHFGGEITSADSKRVFISVTLLGAVTLVPVAYKLIREKHNKKHAEKDRHKDGGS